MAKDPVCGMQVDERMALRAEYEGTTFYFCCDGCRARFQENPAMFAARSRPDQDRG